MEREAASGDVGSDMEDSVSHKVLSGIVLPFALAKEFCVAMDGTSDF